MNYRKVFNECSRDFPLHDFMKTKEKFKSEHKKENNINESFLKHV